ncbi:hypothetical protein GALMADRAFT_284042 [Galerina marginata CBS 339.88]|uniref:Uncharacterized protein n=1 Tax=Galerina marginata (strain CBS 339.88) TaxID=685588 RepID=A0A067SH21_GALM3|nr:hypothetical protein GALMADRAFT_284042 [Galerina marginata CBS 339.88]
MTVFLRSLLVAIAANMALVAAVPSPSTKPGCVIINDYEFCTDGAPAPVISPDDCVSINTVRFCSQAQAADVFAREEAMKPGCVTINTVEFCSDVALDFVIRPDDCVSINTVRFCSQA